MHLQIQDTEKVSCNLAIISIKYIGPHFESALLTSSGLGLSGNLEAQTKKIAGSGFPLATSGSDDPMVR